MQEATFNFGDSTRSFLDGTQPLWKAFWLVYVAVSVAYALVVAKGMRWVFTAEALQLVEGWSGVVLLVLALSVSALLYFAYFIMCFVVVWRCSEHHPQPLWRWAARVVIVLHALWWALQIALLLLYFGGIDVDMQAWF